MVFVGLFAGTVATWQAKLRASLIVGAVIYVLNLIRNTGIIWFYGQGHASFWVMHDAIGKGGSLAAMILIAFGVFRWFPEFFTALTGVLDLVDRDGPIERGLKLGKRRPEATTATVPTPS
jgi:exosortase/archaeosortase family protein